jgi:hypothetical protein
MNPLGFVFMILSLAFVWSLLLWCLRRVLTLPAEEDQSGG